MNSPTKQQSISKYLSPSKSKPTTVNMSEDDNSLKINLDKQPKKKFSLQDDDLSDSDDRSGPIDSVGERNLRNLNT